MDHRELNAHLQNLADATTARIEAQLRRDALGSEKSIDRSIDTMQELIDELYFTPRQGVEQSMVERSYRALATLRDEFGQVSLRHGASIDPSSFDGFRALSTDLWLAQATTAC